MRLPLVGVLLGCLMAGLARGAESNLFAAQNLYAWCIVPYDSPERTPVERMQLLKNLGLTSYVWDWRDRHIASLPSEIESARAAGITLRGVWIWIDARADSPEKLSEANEAVFSAVEKAGLALEYWVGFNENFFAAATEDERVDRGVKMIAALRDRAVRNGSSVALYNHGGWFGDPRNEVKLIEAAGRSGLGIVYNFHHGHEHLSIFAELVPVMLPYLRAVNLNGMRKGGPMILPIGEGDEEAAMVRTLINAGYTGPFGVLGHVEGVDVAGILKRNLEGLHRLADKL